MAAGAVVNAAWDLAAKRAGKPLWRFLADMSPEELVAQVDFRWLSDALTGDEALDILRRARPGRARAHRALLERGYPAYTTTPGWLGYADEKLARLSREAVADGFSQIKLKVGATIEDDVRRMRTAREAVGAGVRIAVDANQRWDVQPAIDWMRRLAPYRPVLDRGAHLARRHPRPRRGAPGPAPIQVATGEHVANRVVFKQLLQAGAVDIVQIDAARVGGVNENIAILLLAAKFGVPVCPHAGGVGLCEMVQHLSMFDFVAVSGTMRGPGDRVRRPPARALRRPGTHRRRAGTSPPTAPGLSAQMHPASLDGTPTPTARRRRPRRPSRRCRLRR